MIANKGRVRTAIKVMEEVRSKNLELDMNMFRSRGKATSLDNADCGTVCCFAGWLALSKEFQEAGGRVSELGPIGSPGFGGRHGPGAICKYLNITVNDSFALLGYESSEWHGARYFYEKDRRENITFDDVISKLNHLLEFGNFNNLHPSK